APLEVLGDMEALVTLHEGRYHQVRRMFAAVGNHVVTLKRVSLGGLKLPSDLEEGAWRVLTSGELDQVFG
ncbi:16S rRNA pseudouridine(516) synthase, partial [Verrucomicrobiales bacterium]|nr:16S rRNA pseudouridine(516) synthase [Verrucomicrobiales bacterium]